MIGVTFLGEALKQVKPRDGKLSVPELAKALEKVTYTSPLGTYTMRAGTTRCSCRWWFPRSARTPVQGRRHRHGLQAGQVLSAADVSAPVQSTCKMVRPN